MKIGNERNRKMSKKKCVIGIILAMIFSFGISMVAYNLFPENTIAQVILEAIDVAGLLGIIIAFGQKRELGFSVGSFIEGIKLNAYVLAYAVPFFIYHLVDWLLGNGGPDFYANTIGSALILFLTAGMREELLFRGIAFNFIKATGELSRPMVIIASVISALLFGILHFSNYFFGQDLLSTLCQVVYASAIGIFFAAVYFRTKNIWANIAVHFFFDFAHVNMEEVLGVKGNLVGESMSTLIYSIVTIAVAFYLMREKKLQPVLQG